MGKSETGSKVDLSAIDAAIRNPRWAFRSAEGIAEDLGVPPEVVAQRLSEHPEIARKSVMRDREGRQLYAAPERRPTLRERLEQIRWVLAH
jgi:hypothetical protein